MPEPHADFQAAIEVGAELAKHLQESRKGMDKQTPFGMEALDSEHMRRRLTRDRSLRQEMLGRPGGREAILQLFRQRRRGG